MSKGHKDNKSDKSNHPLGWNEGETLYVTGDDKTGEVQTELTSVDEMLEMAGVAQEEVKNLNEHIRERLPDDAFLTDDGCLGAENNRSSAGKDYLNGKRRWVLKKLNDGKSPSEIYNNTKFADSYVYRTRGVFGFLLEDDFLSKVFIEDGGEYAPTHEAQLQDQLEKEEQTVSLEEGKGQAPGPEPEFVDSVFDEDEWWDVMKTLLNNDEEELARRITSEIL